MGRASSSDCQKVWWSIYPSGETALNLLGLSTQVPGKYVFFSDGPSKIFSWSGGELTFKKTGDERDRRIVGPNGIVGAGAQGTWEENVDEQVITHLGKKFSVKEKTTALKEALYATGWVYEIIKQVCQREVLMDTIARSKEK